VPVRNIQILVFTMIVCIACYVQAERLKYAAKIGNAMQLIADNYVDAIDPEDLYTAAMTGMVSELDQFSEFIPPARYKEFQAVLEQHFGGLGILVEGPPATKRLTVVAPIPGTPAFQAGLQPGDVIETIAGDSTEGLTAVEATKVMRGPVGEPIRLTLRRMDVAESIEVELKRADIQVDSVYGDRIRGDSSWDFLLAEDARIAYIRVTLFGERTVDEFKRALDQVRGKAEAIVLDLRYNPGGLLPAAVAMCDMLIDDGLIVSTRGRRDLLGVEVKASKQLGLERNIPIVVLLNDQSASASEIMAGALQDAGRAKVAGQRSYGKGTVQQIFELQNDKTALKFTTAHFYRPSGKNIHRRQEAKDEDDWGVSPDPGLALVMSDVQQLNLNRRWTRRGDPRITTSTQAPPAPPFAGDPQLRMAVEYLQQLIEGHAKR
jgi:carboxyl-terminal processing protease